VLADATSAAAGDDAPESAEHDASAYAMVAFCSCPGAMALSSDVAKRTLDVCSS
jgi:hypothetical protein